MVPGRTTRRRGRFSPLSRRGLPFRVWTVVLAVGGAVGVLWGAVNAVMQLAEMVHPAPRESPAFTSMLHTPQLGLQFRQRRLAGRIAMAENALLETVKVSLRREPFEIRFPLPAGDVPVRVCAWRDASIFTVRAGHAVDGIPFFAPGTAMPDSRYGSGRLGLRNDAHNSLVGDRVRRPASSAGGYYVSGVDDVANGVSIPLVEFTENLYLTVLVDKNSNGVADTGEFEFLILEFHS
ncbi:hypothetical protein [Sphaerisporangium sp. TRM90804]|uniref:hypothetical protein n=1 Tax=Sphaerisporangium sp. TRM90804 TaxID=3031113 RepID=UPI00244A8703|nr:hypothetical protein [Sphaerisporangium sp. TRM90804]MDH2426685.1 hypothetical protein [Sphaerisporangium sp. TRM90804]